MAAKPNSITSNNISAAREVTFVSSYTQRIQFIKDMFGDVRFYKLNPGEQLQIKKANVTLNNTPVGEGESIPYSSVNFTRANIGEPKFDKQKIGVSLEAIGRGGYASTIAPADKDAIYKMTSKTVNNLIEFVIGGTLKISGVDTFQMAVAKAVMQEWSGRIQRGLSSYRRMSVL